MPAGIQDILQAVIARFNATSALTTRFTDGLWVGRAKDAETLPVCILYVVSEAPSDWTMTKAYVQSTVLQFSVYGNTDLEVWQALADLRTAFDNAPLALGTSGLTSCKWRGGGSAPDADEKVWGRYVEYEIRTTEQLP